MKKTNNSRRHTVTIIAFIAAALANPAYADKPKDVEHTKNISNYLLRSDLFSSHSKHDPRLDVKNNNLEVMTLASAKKQNGWELRPTISENGNIGAKVAFRYTGGGFKEFLWGISRPVHLYNHNEEGKLEILPFYTHPIKAGGALSPLNPYAWKEDPALTGGALAGDLVIAGTIYALSQSGGSDSKPNYLHDSNGDVVYTTNPTTGEQEPVVDHNTTTSGGNTFVGEDNNTSGGGSGDGGASDADGETSSGGASGGSDGNTGDVDWDEGNTGLPPQISYLLIFLFIDYAQHTH